MRTVEILGETADWLSYDLPPELKGKAWGGRYRGQKQKWFAVRFLGDGERDRHQSRRPATRPSSPNGGGCRSARSPTSSCRSSATST